MGGTKTRHTHMNMNTPHHPPRSYLCACSQAGEWEECALALAGADNVDLNHRYLGTKETVRRCASLQQTQSAVRGG